MGTFYVADGSESMRVSDGLANASAFLSAGGMGRLACDLCRGSGTVLLSRCGRVSRRRGLFAIPSCVASDGTSSTAEQRRSTVRSTRGTGACRHPIPTIPTPGGVRSQLG